MRATISDEQTPMRKLLFKSLLQAPLTEPAPRAHDEMLDELAQALNRTARRKLGRSLSIREVDAGSCNGCELEIHALSNVFYDLERFGLRFVASPRHADVLLVTGPVTRNMREPLERTYRATPDPKWVVAVGDCAVNGGVFGNWLLARSAPGGSFGRASHQHERHFEPGAVPSAHKAFSLHASLRDKTLLYYLNIASSELRRQGGFAKDSTPFNEFLWAHFLRRRIKRKLVESDFEEALKRSAKSISNR
jgi:Ni,Fe-hydrogenase III small subunit